MKLLEDSYQLLILTFGLTAILQCVECSSRLNYGGRVMNISPIECTSPKFPGVKGTCMISLECQQRSGTVIGACRDGHLFGACCHDANASENPSNHNKDESTTTTKALSPLPPLFRQEDDTDETSPNAAFAPNVPNFADKSATHVTHIPVNKPVENKLSISALHNLLANFATITRSSGEETHPEYNPAPKINTPSPNYAALFAETSTTSTTTTQKPLPVSTSSTTTTEIVQTSTTTTSKPEEPIPPAIVSLPSSIPDITTTSTRSPPPVENAKTSEIEVSTTTTAISSSSSTTETPYSTTPSTPTPTTKFVYGKIKYSPRPYKKRPTTKVTVWTRPPTTETSYSVFSHSDESDEDEETGIEKFSKFVVTPRMKITTSSTAFTTASTSGSVETSTIPPVQKSSSMSVETSTTIITNPPVVKASGSNSGSVEFPTTPLAGQNSMSIETSSTITVPQSSSSSVETKATFFPISKSSEEIPTTIAPPVISSSTDKEISPLITETTTTTEAINNVTQQDTPKPIEMPFTTTTTEKQETTSLTPSIVNGSTPIKQSRLSNDISRRGSINNRVEDSSSSSDDSNSAGWENKIDDFVNQVVEGIAVKLDESNIDDVVFKSTSTTTPKPSTTTTKMTTTTTPPKKYSIVNKPKRTKYKTTISTTVPTTPIKYQKISNPSHKKYKIKPNKPEINKKKPVEQISSASDELEDDFDENEIFDYRSTCGVRPLVERQSRIVGGNRVDYGSWPWHALVKETVWWGIFSKVKCGGVLIGPRHVLTAGHCEGKGTLSVVLGVTNSDSLNVNAITKGVRRVIRHPQFNPRSYENDIAILELDSPVGFQPHVVPICLPEPKEDFVGKQGFVTGMGLLKHDGERPSHLHEVDVPILNNTECQSMFRRSGNMKPIKPSFICAGYSQGRKDSCGGDSGGPLSVRRSNGQWVLAGTVSHGIKCAVPNQPGIYMRTTWYLPWVEKVMSVARTMEVSTKCHGPPAMCAENSINNHKHQARSGGLMETIFRIFRLARKLWIRK